MADLTVREVAEDLQVSPATVRGYIGTGKLPAYKLGKEYRIRERDLEAVKQQHETSKPKTRRAMGSEWDLPAGMKDPLRLDQKARIG